MTEHTRAAAAELRVRVIGARPRRSIRRRSTGLRRRRRTGGRATCSRTWSASTDDIVHGRLDGIASDAWTAAQVAAPARCPDRGAARRLGATRARSSSR